MQQKTNDRRMSEDETAGFLAERTCGVVCLNGEDGFPYGVPVNYVVMDGAVYFHGSMSGEKADAIARDPRCCFTVYEDDGFEITGESACNTSTVYRSAVVRGNVSAVADESERVRALRRIVDVLVPERRDVPMSPAMVSRTAVFRIDIVSMTGKRRPPTGGTRVPGAVRRYPPSARSCQSCLYRRTNFNHPESK